MAPLRLRYQTIEFGDTDIHLRTLRNRQEFSDPEGRAADAGITSATWSLFGVVWASGELLARMMYDYDVRKLRILEVGCGIGLASMVLNHRAADITATDHHPEAGPFLSENVKLNKGEAIPFTCTDWAERENTLGTFDLIIGSDLLYERDHAGLLSDFIDHHAKPQCKIILVDPGRGHHGKFTRKMTALGYSYTQSEPQKVDNLSQPMRNATTFRILRFER